MRELARHYLEQFATTRAPLLGDPRAAVMRAISLAAVTALTRGAGGEVALMAARTMEAHLKFAPSRGHAPKRDFAVASALLADVGRAAAGARSYDALADAIQELFARFESESEPMLRWACTYPRAVLLASVLAGATGRAQLRAARTLLGWTRGLARRVGYRNSEKPVSRNSPDAAAVVDVLVLAPVLDSERVRTERVHEHEHVHDGNAAPRAGPSP